MTRKSTTALAILIGAALLGGPAAAQTTTIIQEDTTGSIVVTPEQRTTIKRYVQTRPSSPIVMQERLVVGAPVPDTVELQPLPEELYVESPAMRNYRYFVTQDEVVLVNPQTRRVIQVVPE